MPLTNKYLKYSPEITLEIFEKIWNKLLEVYKVSYPDDLETRFEEFTRGESISLSYDGELGLYLMYSSETKTETTVQEILGYDPFIKEGELDSNKIYHGRIKNYGGYIIFKPNTYELFSQNGDIPNSFSTGNYPSQVIGAVIATKEEWEWLELCISNNKFMEKPFVEEFVLPKSWCLRTTPETDKILCEWRGGGHCSDTKDSLLVYDSESAYPKYWENIRKIDKYQEITFDQFKKYVLKEPTEVKEVIPEYVECIKQMTAFDLSKIYKTETYSEGGYRVLHPAGGGQTIQGYENNFKPSTKEAFDAQNQPKSIEKWSAGSYVLFLEDNIGDNQFKKGDIKKISQFICDRFDNGGIEYEGGRENDINHEKSNKLKWFATKSEAEEFAKTLVEPVKHGNGILDAIEPKQLLKQAVHCKTQEEWNFVKNKINRDNEWEEDYPCQILVGKSNWKGGVQFCINEGYQILSFQEWCQQNGYLMENKCEFKIGKYYRFNIGKSTDSSTRTIRFAGTNKDRHIIADLWLMDLGKKFTVFKNDWNKSNVNNPVELSIEEIQQYLPEGHPDKIQLNPEFKVGDYVISLDKSISYIVGEICKVSKINKTHLACENKPQSDFSMKPFRCFRHATPEEINNHLISIGKIPSGKPIDTGIEPDKNNVFKYTTAYSNTSNNWSTRMDCGESVAKISEQIKLNYLPEPK
mgnify:CR=1 FL=1